MQIQDLKLAHPSYIDALDLILDAACTSAGAEDLPGVELALGALLSSDEIPAPAVLALALLDCAHGPLGFVHEQAAQHGANALWARYEDPYREDHQRLFHAGYGIPTQDSGPRGD